MATVLLTPEARRQFDRLPLSIRVRVQGIFERLAAWPGVRGAKALRGSMAGQVRVRTGDYRVPFPPLGDVATLAKLEAALEAAKRPKKRELFSGQSRSAAKKEGGRVLINTGTDQRFVRRDSKGSFARRDDVGRSLHAAKSRGGTSKRTGR